MFGVQILMHRILLTWINIDVWCSDFNAQNPVDMDKH